MHVIGTRLQSEIPTFHLREELSIGISEGESEYMFSRISDVAVDSGRRIYVLDYTEAELRIFDEDGKHIQTIGRRGQGPGEFMAPFSLAVTKGNAIMVHDLGNRRISYFSEAGNFLSSFSTGDMVMVGSETDDRGNILSLVFTSGPEEQLLELRRFDSRKNVLTTYYTITKTGREATNNPFGPAVHWTRYLSDRVICGYSKDYELHVYNLDGTKVRTIEREYRPVRIEQEEVDASQKRLPAAVDLQAPKHRPAFQGVTADEEGRIFVATWERPHTKKGYLYDVFDHEGEFLTQIALDNPPQVWKDSRLYTIEEDAGGYPVVRRFRVSWQ